MLLSQHGVGDDTIEGFLQSTSIPDTMMGGPGFGSLGGMGSGSVQVLEHLLQARKPCCADGNTGAPGPMTTVASESRDSSSGSMGTVQSMWNDPIFNSQIRSGDHGIGGPAKPQPHQFMTPSATASRTGSVVSSGRAGSTISVQQHQQQQQRHRGPSLAPSMGSSAGTTTTTSQQKQAMYDFDNQVAMLPAFHPHPHQQQHQQQHHPSHGNITTANQLAQAHTQSHPLAPVSRSSQYMPTSTPSSTVAGTNSCIFATDMITSMAGGEAHDVRADLGCMPNGMECEVDNQLVFNVMDRYSGPGIGL